MTNDTKINFEYNLTCSILRDDYRCHLNLFNDETRVKIINDPKEAIETYKKYNCVVIYAKTFYFGGSKGETVYYAYPVTKSGILKDTGMFGGAWIYTSDSRFLPKSPIRLMDRIE